MMMMMMMKKKKKKERKKERTNKRKRRKKKKKKKQKKFIHILQQSMQPNLTAIIQSRRLSIFGHIARMDDHADAKIILTAPPPENWKTTTRASSCHVAEHHPMRSESVQPHTERCSRPGSELPSVEADVYALLMVHA